MWDACREGACTVALHTMAYIAAFSGISCGVRVRRMVRGDSRIEEVPLENVCVGHADEHCTKSRVTSKRLNACSHDMGDLHHNK